MKEPFTELMFSVNNNSSMPDDQVEIETQTEQLSGLLPRADASINRIKASLVNDRFRFHHTPITPSKLLNRRHKVTMKQF